MENTAAVGSGKNEGKHPGLVTITINGRMFPIRRGNHAVADIKRLASIPEADVLCVVVDGRLNPLPDLGHVVIKGNEVFVSHPKDCAAS